MPNRDPRPRNKLTDPARLSVAIMERVGAMLRKAPPKDVARACEIMREERDKFLGDDPKYARERAQGKADGAVPFVLASIAANAVERILDHETQARPADVPPVKNG